ncbi:uncharacterized protein LOC141660901 [Apium graveolens]|uniref:uncharacterized protein LOC141660901 n=1 Tax=Apium graveolens TaxID=4045 RepID=UPI003D7A4BD8
MANKKPSVKYFHMFGGECFVLKDDEHLDKFDAKAEEGIFLGYSLESKDYRIYMLSYQKVVKSLNVTFDNAKLPSIQKKDSSDNLNVEDLYDDKDEPEVVPNNNDNGNDPNNDYSSDSDSGDPDDSGDNGNAREQIHSVKWCKSHHVEEIIGYVEARVQTRRANENECLYSEFLCQIEPKNKLDQEGIVTRIKVILVVKGYSQEERIDYDETFTPVAKLEAIVMFLAFAAYSNFKVYQTGVKNALLNGELEEEVYVEQPPGFIYPELEYFVYLLFKALYGLK